LSWANIKAKFLGDSRLLPNLIRLGEEVEIIKNANCNKARDKFNKIKKDLVLKEGETITQAIGRSSKACAALWVWCEATMDCYEIKKKVTPLEERARKLTIQKEKGEAELAATKEKVARLQALLSELNAKLKIKKTELDDLVERGDAMTAKLNKATQLINGLASEQKRWGADMEIIKIDKVKLVGDCLTGSAFLSYCGPFNSPLRQRMIFETWKNDIKEKELPNKEDFRLD